MTKTNLAHSTHLSEMPEMLQDDRTHFDVCIVCATKLEARALLDEVALQCGLSFKQSKHRHIEYYFTSTFNAKNEPITILVSWQSKYGPEETISLLQYLINEFQPRFVAMSGTCAGDKRHIKLGDIIVADCTFTYDEVITKLENHQKHAPTTDFYVLDPFMHNLVLDFDKWTLPITQLPQPQTGSEYQECFRHPPECHITSIASVKSVRRDNPFDKIQTFFKDVKVLDMEGTAFYKTLSQFPGVYALLVKGVADYADKDKNDLFYQYASAASAMYLLYFIKRNVTVNLMPRLTSQKIM